jgi:hypothetical protein
VLGFIMRWLSVSSIALSAVSAEYISNAWQAQKFKTLVTFGDSYTDENRLGYFISHNGSAPPVGVDLGVVCRSHYNSTVSSVF